MNESVSPTLSPVQVQLQAAARFAPCSAPQANNDETYQVQPADVAAALEAVIQLEEEGKQEEALARFQLIVDGLDGRILFTELWNASKGEAEAGAAMDAWNALDLHLEDGVPQDLRAALDSLQAALA